LSSNQTTPSIAGKSEKAANKNRALHASITAFNRFKQRMVAPSIFANPKLPGSPENTSLGNIARLQVINFDFRECLRLETPSPGLYACYRVPSAFRHGNQSTQGLETFPPKKLNGARYISHGLSAWMPATAVAINDESSRQAEFRVVCESQQHLLVILIGKANVAIK
jgi:hypothetical protein